MELTQTEKDLTDLLNASGVDKTTIIAMMLSLQELEEEMQELIMFIVRRYKQGNQATVDEIGEKYLELIQPYLPEEDEEEE